MSKRRRIFRKWYSDGQTGFFVVITHHDEGVGDVYRGEIIGGDQLAWVGAAKEAKSRADECVKEHHSLFSGGESDWTPIPQPEPQSEMQKKNAAACFRLLKHRVTSGQPHAEALKALQNEYVGRASDLVDAFNDAPDQELALQHIEAALMVEIEAAYWPQSN